MASEAFDPAGWSHYQPLTTKSSAISAAVPLLWVDLSQLDLTNAQEDLDDLRFSNSDDDTSYPYTLIGNKSYAVVDASSFVSTSVDVELHVWTGNSGASAPGDVAANADSALKLLCDMSQDPSGSAPQILDFTANGYDGTSQGSMTSGDSVSGVIGNELDFDGVNDAISFGNVLDIGTGDYSVLARVSFDQLSSTAKSVAGKGYLHGSLKGGGLFATNAAKPAFMIANSGSEYWATGSTTLSTGTRYLLCGTIDRDAVESIYLDGVLDGTADPTPASAVNLSDSNSNFTIGARNHTSQGNLLFTDGQIDLVMVWSRCLSSDEVATLSTNLASATGVWTFGEIQEPDAPLSVPVVAPTTVVIGPDLVPGGVALTVTMIAPEVVVTSLSVINPLSVPVIVPSTVVAAPEVIPGEVSVTVPLVITPDVTVTSPLVAAVASLTVPTIAPDVTITAPGISRRLAMPVIAPDVACNAPSVVPGAVSLTVPVIAPEVTVSAPSIRADLTLTPGVISPTVTVTAPGIAYRLAAPTIAPATVVTAPTVVPGATSITVPVITASAVVNAPAMTPGTKSIAAGSITPETTVTSPDASLAALSLTVPTIAPDTSVTAPNVDPGSLSIAAGTIAPEATVSSPTLQPGAAAISVPVISPEITVSTPSRNDEIRIPITAIRPETVLAAPSVTSGGISVASETTSPETTVTSPQLRSITRLSAALIAPDTSVTSPVVHRKQVPGSITPDVTVSDPEIVRGGLTLSTETISPETSITSPTLRAVAVLTVPTIAPETTVTAPTVATALTVSVPVIECSPTVNAPTVSKGGRSLTLPIIQPSAPVVAVALRAVRHLAAGIAIAGTVAVTPPSLSAATWLTPEPIECVVATEEPTVNVGDISTVVPICSPETAVADPEITGQLSVAGDNTIAPNATITAPTLRTSAHAIRSWRVAARSFTWMVPIRAISWTVRENHGMANEILHKQPAESIVFAFDFSELLTQTGGELSSVTSILAFPTGLALTEKEVSSDGTKAQARIEGGTAGQLYKLTAIVVTTGGDTIEADGKLHVRD